MSELVRPNFLTIPGDVPEYEHRTDERIAGALLRFATSGQMVEVFRNIAPTSDEAIQRLQRRMPRIISFDSIDGVYNAVPFNWDPGDDELGLHIDYTHPPALGSLVMPVAFHHTSAGSARARFLRINTERIMEWYSDPYNQSGLELLPADVADTYRTHGVVDPYYLHPEGIETITGPGDVVLFKEALPLAHEFVTLDGGPRRSEVITGSVVINPQLHLPGFET